MKILFAVSLLALSACSQQSLAVKMVTNPSKYHVGKSVSPSQIRETESEIIIIDSTGGWLEDWETLGVYTYINNKRLRIMNGCFSGCSLAADIVRRNGGKVCVSNRAVFGYHNANHGTGDFSDLSQHYSPEIVDWVKNNGGWLNSHKMTLQSGKELQRFYELCEVK